MLESLILDSPLRGTLIALDEVNDKIFSGGAAGRGAAIKNPDGKIFAPFAGTVEFLASPGVLGLKSFGGVELLIHVGLNTCKLIGETFQPRVTAGDTIQRGQILLTFDLQEMIRGGFDSTTPVIVTNPENFGDIVFRLGARKIFAQRAEKFLFGNLHGAFELKNFIASTWQKVTAGDTIRRGRRQQAAKKIPSANSPNCRGIFIWADEMIHFTDDNGYNFGARVAARRSLTLKGF